MNEWIAAIIQWILPRLAGFVDLELKAFLKAHFQEKPNSGISKPNSADDHKPTFPVPPFLRKKSMDFQLRETAAATVKTMFAAGASIHDVRAWSRTAGLTIADLSDVLVTAFGTFFPESMLRNYIATYGLDMVEEGFAPGAPPADYKQEQVNGWVKSALEAGATLTFVARIQFHNGIDFITFASALAAAGKNKDDGTPYSPDDWIAYVDANGIRGKGFSS